MCWRTSRGYLPTRASRSRHWCRKSRLCQIDAPNRDRDGATLNLEVCAQLFHLPQQVDFVRARSAAGTGYLDYGDTPAFPGVFEGIGEFTVHTEFVSSKVAGDTARIERRFCIAPMMDYSDRHSRFFLRLLSPRILLYTEMVTAAAVVHGDHRRLLEFSAAEHPLAVQLGGADPELLYRAWTDPEHLPLIEESRNALMLLPPPSRRGRPPGAAPARAGSAGPR